MSILSKVFGGGGKERGGLPVETVRQAGSTPVKTAEVLAAERMASSASTYAGMEQGGEALRLIIGQQYRNPLEMERCFDLTMTIREAKAAKAAGGNGTQG